MGFGYGMSVSIAQLARAYAVIANEGRLLDLSLVRKEVQANPRNQITRHVMKATTARAVLQMMAKVVGPKGTAQLAAIPGYQIAGKTGTAKKSIAGGYRKDDYVAVFAGIAPVSNPRLVMAVIIDEPTQNGYYGGLVAAPVFRDVVSNALRILDIPPDDLPTLVQTREQGA
jgi:cell division protein FtsI (penicillin-binding protein 3)